MSAIPLDVAQGRGLCEPSPQTRLPGRRQSLPDRRNHASRKALLRRVRAEFDEMQGLTLTFAQTRRLFGLRDDICVRVLNTLLRDGVLWVSSEGVYARSATRA
jgi:hypothetical protein